MTRDWPVDGLQKQSVDAAQTEARQGFCFGWTRRLKSSTAMSPFASGFSSCSPLRQAVGCMGVRWSSRSQVAEPSIRTALFPSASWLMAMTSLLVMISVTAGSTALGPGKMLWLRISGDAMMHQTAAKTAHSVMFNLAWWQTRRWCTSAVCAEGGEM